MAKVRVLIATVLTRSVDTLKHTHKKKCFGDLWHCHYEQILFCVAIFGVYTKVCCSQFICYLVHTPSCWLQYAGAFSVVASLHKLSTWCGLRGLFFCCFCFYTV